MAQPSAEKLAQRAFDLGLLTERQMSEVWASFGSRNVPVTDLVQVLLRREFMTNYQIDRLAKGERSGFFFGDYKVLYLVGSGTFARVFRAVHTQTGQIVALKVLRGRFSEAPAQFGYFVREGRVGCTLRHPNIVPIYEVVSEGKNHFLVMEFVEGWNLRQFVKIRRNVEAAQAIQLMTGICRGMQYAFENGLTHRDLKMNNVLVSSRGEAKLVDFGLAAMDETLADDQLADLPNTRTIDYAALERASGVRKDDTRSDIYFLGCIFYHMLAGVPPLVETKDRLQRLSRSRFLGVKPIRKLVPNVPDSVSLVLNKAMMLDPTRRYQSPGEMVADLEIAARRVAEDPPPKLDPTPTKSREDDEPVLPDEPVHTVMIVESNTEMQNVFRSGFKRAGYRVLLTADPLRAVARFRQDAATADCVVFNAQELGAAAVEGFNEFGEDRRISYIPNLLLLDETQKTWKEEAIAAPNRVVLTMPITMKQLRATLAKLIAEKASRPD